MPTVAVHTHVFARLAQSVARVNGMPVTRQAFVPQPVVGRSPAELRAYIEGADPINGRPFMQEVIDGLTRPLAAEDARRRLVRPLHAASARAGHGGEPRSACSSRAAGPTSCRSCCRPRSASRRCSPARVRRPDEVVGRLRPTAYREFWEFDGREGGGQRGHGRRAARVPSGHPGDGRERQTARSSSTTSFATVAIVNGPIRNEIGMSSGIGAMGPYNHANATIGRAYGLVSQNLQGGSVPGETYMGSQGNPLAYSFAFPENEEGSPWEPFHVRTASRPSRAPSASSSAAGTRSSATARATPGRSGSGARCGPASPIFRRSSPSIRSSPAASSSVASTRSAS